MERKKIIKEYINAYNNFDIEKMLTHLDEHIKFENISNGVTNMTLTDLNSFRKQAEQAKKYSQPESRPLNPGHTKTT